MAGLIATAAFGGILGAATMTIATLANRFMFRAPGQADGEDGVDEELFKDLPYLRARADLWAHILALCRNAILELPDHTHVRGALVATERWAHMASFLRVESTVEHANQFWAQYTVVHDAWVVMLKAIPGLVVRQLGDTVVLRDRAMQLSWSVVDSLTRKESEGLRAVAWRAAATRGHALPPGEPPLTTGPRIPTPGTPEYRDWLRQTTTGAL